ncbi:MAG: HNH endonuclease signature motif containing protein [Patescibacteria group bacterium]|jgi:hypothetical protein
MTVIRSYSNLSDLFFDNIDEHRPDKCWEWLGSKTPSGYGILGRFGKTILAHRLSYMIFKDEIQEGLEIDHLCCNKSCVNPWHLEAVSHSENLKRSYISKSKEYHRSVSV